mgnify:FL=1
MDNSNNNKPQVPPQPQFQQAPQQPQVQQPQPQQQFPQQPVMGTPYQMPPKKKMGKGAMWGLIGGIIGLVVIILGVVLAVLLLSGPSKADYKDLLSQFTGFDINNAFISKSNTITKNRKAEIDDTIKKIDDLNKKMGSHKALRDKDVKAAYDKYLDSWNNGAKEYVEFIGAFVENNFYEKCMLAEVSKHIRESKESVEKYFDSNIKDCINSLDKMSKSNNKLAAKYGEDLKKYYSEIKQYYAELSEYIKNASSGASKPKAPTLPKIDIKSDTLNKWKEASENFKKVLEEKANK